MASSRNDSLRISPLDSARTSIESEAPALQNGYQASWTSLSEHRHDLGNFPSLPTYYIYFLFYPILVAAVFP